MLDFLKIVIIVSLFWAFAVTSITAILPSQYLTPVSIYINSSNADTLNTIGTDLESSLTNQLNIPLIDAAALVFYSGNMIVDLFLNFLTAVPQMFTLILEGFFLLVPNIAPSLQQTLKLFVFTIISCLYFLGIISFLGSSRSQSGLI